MFSRRTFTRFTISAWHALVAVGLVCLEVPATIRAADVYLFVEPADSPSRSTAGVVTAIFESLLEDLPGNTVIKVNLDFLGSETLDEYIARKAIGHFVHAKVQSSNLGLLLRIKLTTPLHQETVLSTPGTENTDYVAVLTRELRDVSLVYRAMLAGYHPDNLVFIDCFVPGRDDDPYLETVSRDVTTGLSGKLATTDGLETYWLHGVDDTGFTSRCAVGARSAIMDSFDFVISGSILQAGDDPDDNQVKVCVRIERRALIANTASFWISQVDGMVVADSLAVQLAKRLSNWQ